MCPFLGVCLGTIEGCNMKQHLPVYIPKRLSDGGTGTFTPTVKFQMLDNCLLMKIQLEGQLRIGRGKPKSSGSVQPWCVCWRICIFAKNAATWSVDKQFKWTIRWVHNSQRQITGKWGAESEIKDIEEENSLSHICICFKDANHKCWSVALGPWD